MRCVCVVGVSRVRRGNRSGRAIEQPRPEFVLQRVDLACYRGSRHAQAGGRREAAGLHNRSERCNAAN